MSHIEKLPVGADDTLSRRELIQKAGVVTAAITFTGTSMKRAAGK